MNNESTDAVEYYTPDPNAPIHHKLNPCHCDHIDALNWVQSFFEFYGSHCQCCSGMRIFLLFVACLVRLFDTPVAGTISNIILFIVGAAIVYGNFVRWRDEFVRMHDVDSDTD